MKCVRIKSYLPTVEFTSCEHIYLTDSHTDAITKFRAEYPEHKDCIVVAEDCDTEENAEHFAVCARCGCVH